MSTRARLREFLATHRGKTSPAWRQQIGERARAGVAWPNPWVMAKDLGLTLRVISLDGLRYSTIGREVWIGDHPDRRVLGHRLAMATAQHLLELSNARWSTDDVYLLAFELLMPTASVRATARAALASCQPHAYPALVETWAEHVCKSA